MYHYPHSKEEGHFSGRGTVGWKGVKRLFPGKNFPHTHGGKRTQPRAQKSGPLHRKKNHVTRSSRRKRTDTQRTARKKRGGKTLSSVTKHRGRKEEDARIAAGGIDKDPHIGERGRGSHSKGEKKIRRNPQSLQKNSALRRKRDRGGGHGREKEDRPKGVKVPFL